MRRTMKLTDVLPFRTAVCGLLLLVVSVRSDGLVQEYCSSENTGSGDGPVYNMFQSLGSCSTLCSGDNFAFGVVQGVNCWCSNYIPAEQSATSDCSSTCPGYPYELCGNTDEGLFGYIALDRAPLGTAGAPTSTKSTKSPTPSPNPPTSEVSQTVTRTVTQVRSPSLSVVVSYVTPIPSSTSVPSSSSSAEVTTTKSEVMTMVSTISGSAVTQTVTTTPAGIAPNNDPGLPSLKREGLSGGAIAGVVIGTLLGVALIALGAIFLLRRRRNSDTEGGSSGSPKRKGSVLSRTGLLGAARPQSMAENNNDDSYYANPVTRTSSIRHSVMFGVGTSEEGISPVSPLGSSQDAGSDRRVSKPLVYDQRLNPSALLAHHDNGSRVSMQDQQDYSRPLGLVNADFPRTYSFDSR